MKPEKVSENENNIRKIFELLENQEDKLNRIETALLGDADMGSKGFVERYEQTEKEVQYVKKETQRIKWIATGVAIAISTVFNFITGYFK